MAGLGISGKDGDVKISGTAICEIMKWSFNPKCNVPAYASNKTSGYKRRVAGVKDGSGSMEGAWDPATPAITVIDPGTGATLRLYINATQYYDVPAVIESFKLDVDVDTGEIVKWSADFGTNGAWTNPVAGLMLPPGMTPPDDLSDGAEFVPSVPLQSGGQPVAPSAPMSRDDLDSIISAVTEAVTIRLEDRIKSLVQPQSIAA